MADKKSIGGAAALTQLMRKAGIPPAYQSARLSETPGCAGLAKVIADTSFMTNGQRIPHILQYSSKGMEGLTLGQLLALTALTLIRVHETVHFVSMASLARMLRLYENNAGEEDFPTYKRGDGVLVLSDYTDGVLSPRERADVETWIAEHISRGGGLVIGRPRVADGHAPGDALQAAMYGARTIDIGGSNGSE